MPTLQSAEQSFDKTAAELGRLRLSPPTKVTARDGAGFLGGLLLYVLALNYLRYGKDGVKGWLGAKFVNRPMTLPDDGGDGGGDETGPGALEELLGGPLDLNRPKTPEQP